MTKRILFIRSIILLFVLSGLQISKLEAQTTCRIYCPDGSSHLVDCNTTVDPCKSVGTPGPGPKEPSSPTVKQLNKEKARDLNHQGILANEKGRNCWDKNDLDCAVSYFKEAIEYYRKAKELDNDKIYRENLERNEKYLVQIANQKKDDKIARDDLNARSLWAEGRLAIQNNDEVTALAKFKQAMITRPEIFTKVHSDYILQLEADIKAKETNLKAQKERQVKDQITSNKIQQNIQNLATILNVPTISTDMDFMSGDTKVVDVRNEPVSLRTDHAITEAYKNAPPGVSDMVRKGFQFIMTKKWDLAKASFQDALKLDPENKELKKFIFLCDYTPPGTQQINTVAPSETNTIGSEKNPTIKEFYESLSRDNKIADKLNTFIPTQDEVKQWFTFCNKGWTAMTKQEIEWFNSSPIQRKMGRFVLSLTQNEYDKLINANLTNKQMNNLMFENLLEAVIQETPENKTHQ